MTYKVIITPLAKIQLDNFIGYTKNTLKNVQAAKGIFADAQRTKHRLSFMADSFPLCENNVLAKNGYRKILFKNYQFFMLYRINDNLVIVEAMYHQLQDYESLFFQEQIL